jgi:hypothetical protein
MYSGQTEKSASVRGNKNTKSLPLISGHEDIISPCLPQIVLDTINIAYVRLMGQSVNPDVIRLIWFG